MRVLVTGGRGYIGGRLVKCLSENSAFRLAIAGRVRAGKEGNATVIVDWHDPASIEAACRGQDAIVHLAAMNEPDCQSNPEEALRINGLATLIMVRAAVTAGVSRLVYVSTSKVFGANPTGILTEDNVPRPASYYAITHRLAEDFVLSAGSDKTLKGIVLRLSNSVGAPADMAANAWMVIANDLCRQAASESQIVLKSSGLAWRNFIGLADVIGAIRHALNMPQDQIGDGLFHLGGPRSDRIWDLAQLIARRGEALFGHPIELKRAPPLPGEYHPPLDWRIEKLVATGWSPHPSLQDEIDATLCLCREIFGGNSS